MRRALVGALVMLSLASPAVPARAGGAYRLIDAEGITHITDTPTDTRFQRIAGGFSGSDAGWLKVPQAARNNSAFAKEIRETADKYGVSVTLVEAVIRTESAFNPWAVSRKGAQGLMQLMPQTANALGVRDSFNPKQNIDGGVRHLRYLLNRYPGNVPLAVAAYNAGESAVDQYRGIPPYPETRQYVQKVMERSGGGATAPSKSEAPKAVIYRYEDNEGTLTFSNLPPVIRAKDSR